MGSRRRRGGRLFARLVPGQRGKQAMTPWPVLLPFITSVWFAPYSVAAQAGAAAPSPVLKTGVVVSPPPTRTLSLGACFQRAELYNKEIVSAQWALPLARAGIKMAGAIPNPQFQLQAGFGPSFTSLITGQNQMIQWTQQFLTAGKRSKRIALARANYVLARLQLEALRFDVHNRVRRAYAEQAAAEAYAELIEAQRAVGLKLAAIAEKRFQAGKAPQTEVLQAKLSVSQFDTLNNQAQIRLQQASAALGLLIGETPEHIEVIDVNDNGLFTLSAESTEIVPSPARALPPAEQLLAAARQSRPDWKAAQQAREVARRALVLARTQKIPDLFVGGGYQYSTWSRHQPPELSPAPNSFGNGAYITVTAENPIFYQYQGEVEQAAAACRQADRQCDLLGCQIARDVVTAYNEVSVARSNIFIFQKDLLPTAAQVAELARRGYQVGKTDLATAIVAQQQYQQILQSYFDAVVSYQTAWADLEKAVGAPLRL